MSLVFLALVLTGCDAGTAPEEAVPVSITLSLPSAELLPGDTARIGAMMYAADGSPVTPSAGGLRWSSSDASIAVVDANGVLHARTSGDVTVTASYRQLTASKGVGVGGVGSVAVTPREAQLEALGATAQLSAEVRSEKNTPLSREIVTWTSLDPAVAGVAANGVVTASAVGSARIVAASGGKADTVRALVRQVVRSVSVTPAAVMVFVDEEASFVGTALDANGNRIPDVQLNWAISNTHTAELIGNGRVRGRSAGAAAVNVSSGEMRAGATLEVVLPPVASISLAPSSASLYLGQTLRFGATLRDARGVTLTGRTVTWTSSNPSAASVDASGNVAALAVGTTTITATSEGQTATSSITVSQLPVASVGLSPLSPTVFVGGTVQMTATLRDPNGSLLTGRAVTWTSSNPAVASVGAGGLVTGVAGGIATITASAEGHSAGTPLTVAVQALAPVANISLTPSSAGLVVAQTAQLVATVRDAAGNVLSGRTVSWTSAAPSIASVSTTGLVTAVAAGNATITAMSEGRIATAAISVAAPAPAPVATVEVSPSTVTLAAGATATLAAITKDAEGRVLAGRAIAWSSSNAAAATVSASGVVTAVAGGTATITATSEGRSGTASVAVQAATAPVAGAGAPELPRAYVDTRFPSFSGRIVRVAAGENLQNALDAAQPGDQLLLERGASFAGNFVLPRKDGVAPILIRTDAELPAAGVRISPSASSSLAKIVSPNADPALRTASRASNYRIVGVEITAAPSVTLNYGLVAIDSHLTADASLQSRNIVLDRVYVHGNSRLTLSRCVNLNGAANAVIDSYISECHGKGFDTQAILSYNGTGPFKIVNNYLEGAGENVMFGGADTRIPNNVPSDIEIRGNHFFKPLSWRGVWSVKNILELKNARRVLIADNVLENNWTDAQAGFGVLFTPRNQDGSNPWAAVQDVMFRNNIIRGSAHGINILGRDSPNTSQETARIRIEGNLITEGGRIFQVLGGADIQIANNTVVLATHTVVFDGPSAPRFVFLDNVIHHGEYGIFGSGAGTGLPALNQYAPGFDVRGNVFFAGTGFNASRYPAGNEYAPTIGSVGFVDYAGGNYRLATNSPYLRSSTTGRAPGADFTALAVAASSVR